MKEGLVLNVFGSQIKLCHIRGFFGGLGGGFNSLFCCFGKACFCAELFN